MAIQIKNNNGIDIEKPTFIVSHRYGKRLGAIQAQGIVYKKSLASYSELAFSIYKNDNQYWDEVKDFQILWCAEWNEYFEIYVTIDETNALVKNITAKSLGEAELSQVNIYDLEINTESDREREEYEETQFYNATYPDKSLLHKVLAKAPHYSISHVDNSLLTLTKSFSFDDVSIYDALLTISQEINCLFIISVSNNSSGEIARTVSAYDLESYCLECGYRGEFLDSCPNCESDNISLGYGSDTTIFVNAENLADEITYSCNTDNVKNCFRLVGGDDTVTQAIKDCNPNGNYIWYFSDDLKSTMSSGLDIRLTEYAQSFDYYQNGYDITTPTSTRNYYNQVATTFNNSDKQVDEVIEGYAGLMQAYYNSLDVQQYITSVMMPAVQEPQATTASAEATKLINYLHANQIAVKKLSSSNDNSATSAITALAKTVVSSDYDISANEVTYTKETGLYKAKFIIENKDDNSDRYTTSQQTVTIVQDQSIYIEQLIHKELYKMSKNNVNKMTLFESSKAAFTNALPGYNLDYQYELLDNAQDIVNLLVQEGLGNRSAWTGQTVNLYTLYYVPYYEKLGVVKTAIATRKSDIEKINTLQSFIDGKRAYIQAALNLESYLGSTLWREFCSYRREDTYKNDNYKSDGLTNSQIMAMALDFVNRANKDIYKSAVLQHSITANLKNLLVINEFQPLIDSFDVGNWLRLRIDDKIYRLRLLDYQVDFENLNNITVTFSDVTATYDGLTDLQSIINSAASMATSFDALQRQAARGERSNELLNNWVERGLSVTNTKIISNADEQEQTWDSHGMLFRRYDALTDDYEDTQLKIINSTMAITDDNWETVKTAVGGFYYYNTTTQQMEYAYGINAETIVGKLILGEQMRIVNAANSLSFDEDGLYIHSNNASFKVSLNDNNLLTLANSTENVFYIDNNGVLHIKGDGAGLDLSNNNLAVTVNNQGLSLVAMDGDISDLGDDLSDLQTDLSTNYYTKAEINLNPNSIISSVQDDYNGKFTTVNQKLNSVTVTVSDGQGGSTTTLTANAVKLAWNNISQNIKFEGTYSGAQMNIYNSSNQLQMRVDTSGQHFYFKGTKMGKIGTNNWTGETNFKGLVFDLESDSKYMCWAVDEGEGYYDCKLIYLNGSRTEEIKEGNTVVDRITYPYGLHFWERTYANGNLYLDGSHRFIRFRKQSGQYKADDGVGYNGKMCFVVGTTNASTHTTSYTTYSEFDGRKFTIYNGASVNFYANLNMNNFSILNQSDVRLKDNLAPTQINALDIINSVDMYEFDWINDNIHVPLGIIAQQLQVDAPQLVGTDENGYKYIKTTDMIMYLWKAVQELSTGTYTKAAFNENDYVKVRPDIAPTGASGDYVENEDYINPVMIPINDEDVEEEENE